MKNVFTFLLLSIPFLLFGQNGSISGTITEADGGFEVIGGNVMIQGTGTGASTELDGTYTIKNLEPGAYNIEISYIGFETVVKEGILVKANEDTKLDVKLGESAVALDVVEVSGQKITNSEGAVVAMIRNSSQVLDGVSSAQISKSGDSDVAAAVKRVSGVTVQGGKYIYVRGLGDRYSKTTLNGTSIPGLDPNRNAVQMDIFPTSMVDNIIVYKTFSPQLTGEFTGGLIDIATKNFPEAFEVKGSVSMGVNTSTHFGTSFIGHENGSTDWLGMDDGTRAIPTAVQGAEILPAQASGSGIDQTRAMELTNQTTAFANNFDIAPKKILPNHGFSLSVGNTKDILGKKLGFNASVNYSHKYNSYDDGISGDYSLTGQYDNVNTLSKQFLFSDVKSTENVIWGAMLNSGLKLNNNNKISFSLMHNQSGTSSTRIQDGAKHKDDPDEGYNTRSLQFLERAMSTAQLGGKHTFEGLNDATLEWKAAGTLSGQEEPDLRFFTYRYVGAEDDRRYFLKRSSDRLPVRYFRDMNEVNLDNKVDFTLPYAQWNGLTAKLKVGGSYLSKTRTYRENKFVFDYANSRFFDGDVSSYFNADNVLNYSDTESMYYTGGNGTFVTEGYDPANEYDAAQQVAAGYVMTELPLTNQLELVAGARMEKTTLQFETFSEDKLRQYEMLDGEANILDNLDILPAINLNYNVSDKMKIRVAASRTLARPTFRELSPVETFDFMGGFITIGNPDLKRTLITNTDLRWEFYPQPKEMISVGLFYKDFQNPIERTYNPQAVNGEYTFRNVDNAKVAGIELEFKKGLGFICNALNKFNFATNATYVYSTTDIDEAELAHIRGTNPNAAATRTMYGQAPFSINGMIGYDNEKGTKSNVVFNMVGPRIAFVTFGGTPNIFEMPRATLDYNFSHQLSGGTSIKFSATNLLNAKYRLAIPFKGTDYDIQSNALGMGFSAGVSFNLK